MTIDLLEEISPIVPLDCFAIQCKLLHAKNQPSIKVMRKKFLLPSTSKLLNEVSFAEVAIAWNEQAIYCDLFFDKLLESTDKIELFFDTRDLKTISFTHRFCHQFFILPQKANDETFAKEITIFRTEDAHPLCLAEDIQVNLQDHRKSYIVRVIIPAHCLHGYDPLQFSRIAINYRLHSKGAFQHFSSAFPLTEQHPRYWASCELIKGSIFI
ncbi:hypothetical protein [Candidatus Rhabdochlamydia porcellionis]|jgi:hypothetical protein|uniref:Carbohydrate-binding domain-containing protein n=1 Tax=Candidatus Rhabdochlamydia porcellionis TaxID=225148 RepID=A0ABX8YYM0_9BACT|nr:hypothetical protein [Candidatus Rhabdochlamydia porcellionis]QZA58424.1 hypothetical protein RHAB15C_0000297 [Candidatus Rhabdochlamydia porcellionis]